MEKAAMYDAFTRLLRRELIQAQGCTEPIAIAYAAATARRTLGEMPHHIELRCSGNIVKNAMGVVVPNSGGMRGIDVAAVLGILAGRDSMGLEVLHSVTPEDVETMKSLLATDFCRCILLEEEEPLYIDLTAFSDTTSARVVVRHAHTNITYISRGDEILRNDTREYEQTDSFLDKAALTMETILDYAAHEDMDTLRSLLEPQVRLNQAIAQEGITNDYGSAVGKTVLLNEAPSARTAACARAAAGSDARMGGCILPVVINSGSGNQGITVSVPVIEYARALGCTEEAMFRALAISNLTAIHLKSYIGSLSAFCGAVSAACGAGAAITYLLGGGYEEICRTVSNTLGNVGGILCDGAKSSCAAKIYSAVSAAILAAEMSMSGHGFSAGEGIVTDDIEDTIRNVGYVGKVGMRPTDSVVLQLMLSRGKH